MSASTPMVQGTSSDAGKSTLVAGLCRVLRWAGLEAPQTVDRDALREAAIERLADALEQHLDMAPISRLLGLTEAAPQSGAPRSPRCQAR